MVVSLAKTKVANIVFTAVTQTMSSVLVGSAAGLPALPSASPNARLGLARSRPLRTREHVAYDNRGNKTPVDTPPCYCGATAAAPAVAISPDQGRMRPSAIRSK